MLLHRAADLTRVGLPIGDVPGLAKVIDSAPPAVSGASRYHDALPYVSLDTLDLTAKLRNVLRPIAISSLERSFVC